MTTGTVKKVVADRGFGFITGEDGKDYFFHRDSLQAPLSFDVQSGPKGPRAANVREADAA